MRILFTIIIGIILSAGACNSDTKAIGNFKVDGTYVHVDTIVVTHLETGQRIGNREIRDTIYIASKDKIYQVTNHRWRLNYFDSSGWINMAHGDDRPFPSYEATYNKETKVLIPQSELVGGQVVVDPAAKTITTHGIKYVKAQ